MESETVYGSGDNVLMLGNDLCGTLQEHRVMDYLLRSQLRQHP